jgi:hypothetical protein
MAERLYTTDFIAIHIVFRDTETGKYISREKAEEIKKQDPGRIKKETRMILKKRPKGVSIKAKKGKPVSKKDFQKIVNYVKRHNTALSLSRRWGISYKEALRRVRTAERLYKKGIIDAEEFGWYVGS